MAFTENNVDFEKEKKFDDIVFICGTSKFYSDSIFLGKFEYFEKLFGNWKERKNDKYEVIITDFPTKIFQLFLKSLYTNTLPEISSAMDLVSIVKIYDKYLFTKQSKTMLQNYVDSCAKKLIAPNGGAITPEEAILIDMMYILKELTNIEILGLKDIIMTVYILLILGTLQSFSNDYSHKILEILEFCSSEKLISMFRNKDPKTLSCYNLSSKNILGLLLMIYTFAKNEREINICSEIFHDGFLITWLYELSKKSGRKIKKRVLYYVLETCTDISKNPHITTIFKDLADPNDK
jgi:hypothetical protein